MAEEYRMVVDDYAKIILPQDQDSYEFDQVLEAVGTYLEDSSPENLKKDEKPSFGHYGKISGQFRTK